MDPEATLRAMHDPDATASEVIDAADNLTGWLKRGGYAPGNRNPERLIKHCDRMARAALSVLFEDRDAATDPVERAARNAELAEGWRICRTLGQA